MSQKLNLTAAALLAFFICVPGRGQESLSLGDLARQAQKDKDKDKSTKPAARVITNDDIPSHSGGNVSSASAPTVSDSGVSATSGKFVQPGTAPTTETIASPAEGIEKIQSTLDRLDSLDRAALASTVLDGNDSNFPGRANWEAKLFAAKQSFVAQGRALLQEARQLESSAQSMKDIEDPNDPRVKSFSAKLEQLVQENQQNSAAFQAVVAEGRDLLGKQSAH